jgi:predicted helicase
MQSTTKRNRLSEVTTKLYLERQGFAAYLWHEWVSQRGLSLQDTGINLVARKDVDLYAVQCKNWDIEISWRDLKTSYGEK